MSFSALNLSASSRPLVPGSYWKDGRGARGGFGGGAGLASKRVHHVEHVEFVDRDDWWVVRVPVFGRIIVTAFVRRTRPHGLRSLAHQFRDHLSMLVVRQRLLPQAFRRSADDVVSRLAVRPLLTRGHSMMSMPVCVLMRPATAASWSP